MGIILGIFCLAMTCEVVGVTRASSNRWREATMYLAGAGIIKTAALMVAVFLR